MEQSHRWCRSSVTTYQAQDAISCSSRLGAKLARRRHNGRETEEINSARSTPSSVPTLSEPQTRSPYSGRRVVRVQGPKPALLLARTLMINFSPLLTLIAIRGLAVFLAVLPTLTR